MVSRLLRLSSFIILASLLQCVAFAQDESAPQTRLSSKGLAYVNLSTSPANPVSGQPTIILLQFLDPQTKAPRGDLYYKIVIRNDTGAIFVMPGGSTIAGKVGIPYQFDNPGDYQVEVDLNDTDISKSSSPSLDRVAFPVYVTQGTPQEENQTYMNTTQNNTTVNTSTPSSDTNEFLFDGVLAIIAAGLVVFMIRKKMVVKRSKSNSDDDKLQNPK